jgi:hypothetical protein
VGTVGTRVQVFRGRASSDLPPRSAPSLRPTKHRDQGSVTGPGCLLQKEHRPNGYVALQRGLACVLIWDYSFLLSYCERS